MGELIQMERRYTTRNGRPVRIYAVDGGGEFPVHGAIFICLGFWKPFSWCQYGSVSDGTGWPPRAETEWDLVAA